MTEPLLQVRDLCVEFETREGTVRAVDNLSLHLERGEALGLVGESGSGKSVTSMALLRLLRSPGRIASGSVRFEGTELLSLSEGAMRKLRGRRVAMIFQDPMTALNPVFTVGDQIAELFTTHFKLGRADAFERAVEALKLVQMPDAARRARDYPHQLSGGMRQRAMIAMAMACKPDLLIADEPTTALDVTLQAQILDLLRDLRRETGTSVLMITHDLGVVAEFCDRVAVMYAGRIVESADTHALFTAPAHPYTRALLAAVPRLGARAATGQRLRLAEIPGTVPSLGRLPPGCAFAPRCASVLPGCTTTPPVVQRDGDGIVRCHLHAGPSA